MQFSVGSIEKNHTPLAKKLRIEAGEGRAQRFPGTIRLAQKLRRLAISQQRCGLFHNRQDLFSQTHVADRCARNCVAGGCERAQKTVGPGNRNVINLSEIMVRRGQPEDWNRVDAGRRRLVGQLHRGQRLVDGEHRPAKQPDLLPRHDGRRARTKTAQVGQSLRRGVPGFVLPFQNRADALPPGRVILQSGSLRLGPFAEMRRMRIKGLDAGGVCEKIGEQARGVRNLRKGQTLRFHRWLS